MENINLIRKIVWMFHKSTKIEWDELFQEAYLAYLEAVKHYDPARSNASTFLWNCISNHLTNFIKREKMIHGTVLAIDDLFPEDVEPEIPGGNDLFASEFWENLNKEGRFLAEIILQNPENYIYLDPLQVKDSLVCVMQDLGWNKAKIKRGLKNLLLK